MLKPYARSTITKKYRATGVSSDAINLVKDYIDACAGFYYLLEIDEAKEVYLHRGRIQNCHRPRPGHGDGRYRQGPEHHAYSRLTEGC